MNDKAEPTAGEPDRARLFDQLLENVNRQLEMDVELKETMELLSKDIAKSTKSRRVREKVIAIRDLYIAAEGVQGEGRAIFHQLFGVDFEL